jgi:trk system potassium uptake protein TrkA
MKILIAGDGEVGFFLANLLEKEYQDITLIDTQKEKLAIVEKKLGIAPVLGDSTSYRVLKEANVENADLLIAVTSNESTNITTCLIGKKLGARYTIARISNMEYLLDKDILDLKELGIDDLISPESLASREVKYILKTPVLTETFEIDGGKLNIMSLFIDKFSPLIDKTIDQATDNEAGKSFKVAAINRNNNTFIPDGNTRFKNGDHLYFVTTQNHTDNIFRFAGKQDYKIKSLMVIGGSQTGQYIALRLSKYYRIKLIEKDLEKCKKLAMNIPNVEIIHGDGTNIKLLQNEEIYNFDAIVSVTGNSETNIFMGLIAKEFGVKKSIAMVENIGLLDYSYKTGIDSLINKKLVAANFIFRSIKGGSVFSHLYGINAEIQEFTIKNKSKITRKPINELNFPDNALISGIIREGTGQIPLGNFQLQLNDKVYVFSMPQCSKKVSAFFDN